MRLVQRPNRYLVLFDLDGTLYRLRGGSYRRSPLRARVRANARRFLSERLDVSARRAAAMLRAIERAYGEEISIGVEPRFGIPRTEYFRTVWNIPAARMIRRPQDLRGTLSRVRRHVDIAVLSDAPSIWVNRVLRTLRIADLFRGRIVSGEGDDRKSFGNAFRRLVVRYHLNPKRCIVVGDQERTDIIPARAAGMRTIFVSARTRSQRADVSIRSILDIEAALARLTGVGVRGTTGASLYPSQPKRRRR